MSASPLAAGTAISVSLVSHGHGEQLGALVRALAALNSSHIGEVVVTLNVPEPALRLALVQASWPFSLRIIENTTPKGFGANHNAASTACTGAAFCVLNPDVGLKGNPFPALLEALEQPAAGCAYPLQVSAGGVVQMSAREVPTPAGLVRRYWCRLRGVPQRPQPVHWATAACLLFKSDIYQQLGGFDERYFMYCEDVDICIRLQLLGYTLVPCDAEVVHVAAAASHRNARHLAWHVRSLLRLWTSGAFQEFQRRFGVSG